jgi:acyl-CoA synthetase (AMP-forming)/AMP-acid ligase II
MPMSAVDTVVSRAVCNARERPDDLALRFLDVTDEDDWDFRRLDAEARTVAAWLQAHDAAGERALILLSRPPEFVAAFLGCLYAGVVAVPCYPVPHPKQAGRVLAILKDADARVVLTETRAAAMFAAAAEAFPEIERATTLDLAERDLSWGDGWHEQIVSDHDLAFLQYTSGSTGRPKGVQVSHGNLMANNAMIAAAYGLTADTRTASWLPLFHDMGLMKILQATYLGSALALMAPATFIRKPARWVQAVSDFSAYGSGGPNFAFELVAAETTPEERERLDLSSWKLAYIAAEPIRAATLERFIRAFAPCGFDPGALFPAYGLAEATLFVAGPGAGAGARTRDYEPEALEAGLATPATGADPARRLVACGRVDWLGQTVRIVDPDSLTPLPAGRVGEIWVAGANVAGGYWGRPDVTTETFGARTTAGEGPFLRTGDLGFLDSDGQLFVCGRIKDLIIVRGRNLAPEDLELTAATAERRLRSHAVVAFSVSEADGSEAVVVVAESADADLAAEAVGDISARVARAITRAHGVTPVDVAVIARGTMPKTSSGKLQRRRCRELYLSDRLDRLGIHLATGVSP